MKGSDVIREAKDAVDDVESLADMLQDMTRELWPEYANPDLNVYRREIMKHLWSNKDKIFIDDEYKGFFIVRDETEPMTPKRKILNGLRVYIKPEYRKSRLLKQFYDTMFNEYPDYEIWGLTEYHSEHNKVLLKRHEPVAIVYKLKRR